MNILDITEDQKPKPSEKFPLKEIEVEGNVWQTRVSIQEDLKKGLPFPCIPSRNSTAVILSYYGFKPRVYYLMQVLNHQSRAYIVS